MRPKLQKATPPATPGHHKRPRCILVDMEEQFFDDSQTPFYEKPIRTLFRTQDIEAVVEIEKQYADFDEGTLFIPIFDPRRDNALLQLSEENNYLVARDLGSDGAKSFAAAPRECIRDIVTTCPFDNRNFYAVVPPDTPTDIYLDIDYRLPKGEEALFPSNSFEALRDFSENLILCVLKQLIKSLDSIFGTSMRDFVVLQSCTSLKVSFHVHGSLVGGKAFVDAASLKGFLKTAFYSRNYVKIDDSQQSEVSSLESVAFGSVDLAPYSRFACFRLPLCAKKGRLNKLIRLSSSTNQELDGLLQKYSPVVLSEGHLVDYCLITRPGLVGKVDKLLVHKIDFQGEASNPNSGVCRNSKGPRIVTSHSGEAVTSPAIIEICRQLFIFISSEYSTLKPSDLTIRKSGSRYKVYQRSTTWCAQACKKHTSATTYVIVTSKAVAAHCWSSNCPRIIVIQINTLPSDFREKFLLACYPDGQ